MVRSQSMDALINENKIPSLVKIDVEGHEVEVLEGAQAIISLAKPLMIVESFPPNREKTMDFLSIRGYEFLDADSSQSVNEKTNNLFAWHPSGPLKDLTVQKLASG